METLDNRERPFETRKAQSSGGHQPVLRRLDFTLPSRSGLPDSNTMLGCSGTAIEGLVGYVEASRGCLHLCLHCPIPSVYGGRFFVVPQEIVLADIRNLVRAARAHHRSATPTS